MYADEVRKLRQREYDNADLYSDTEKKQLEQKEKLQQNFISYFRHIAKKRHRNSSNSIQINWKRTSELVELFVENDYLPFSKVNFSFAENFKIFIKTAPCGGTKTGTISQNTASTYFSIFKAGLKQAFVDGYLTSDLSAKIKGIEGKETRREYFNH